MITRLFSAALRGVDAQEVEVEVNSRGADKPLIIIGGCQQAVEHAQTNENYKISQFRYLAGMRR